MESESEKAPVRRNREEKKGGGRAIISTQGRKTEGKQHAGKRENAEDAIQSAWPSARSLAGGSRSTKREIKSKM